MNIIYKQQAPVRTSQKSGFTLVEMLVSIALFAMVMVVATGAIFSIIGGNRKAQAINSVVNNLNFSIESMVRDMKTGFRYTCPNGANSYNQLLTTANADLGSQHDLCVAPSIAGTAVSFFSTLTGSDVPVEYKFSPAIKDGSGTVTTPGTIIRTNLVDSTSYNLTSPEINVTDVRFYTSNFGIGNGVKKQPNIFLLIDGEARISDNQVSKFHIQTFVTQRILNL